MTQGSNTDLAERRAPNAPLPFENSFARQMEGFYAPWQGDKVPKPRIELFNQTLAEALGLELDPKDSELAEIFAGSKTATASQPLAQVYAGHQFGGFSAQLGDGRAMLLGEIVSPLGKRFDIHLKGSGPTPFSRGGDGKAALGPVLREYLMGEAMHALGIPTTRALGVVTTGEEIRRQSLQPGAVLVRVASSHIRVGTFQFFASRGEWDKVKQLADYAIARHYPELVGREDTYLAFLNQVAERQALLVAQWMGVGFIHGVMNTDNMAISGETIDFGPCALMDIYDPDTVFSSIDRHGRYAYGNQPKIAQWNLARFAETLLPLIDGEDTDRAVGLATDCLADFMLQYRTHWIGTMRSKFGLERPEEEDTALVRQFLGLMQSDKVDFTNSFRHLAKAADGQEETLIAQFEDHQAITGWIARWRERLGREHRNVSDIASQISTVNPLYIPRNHLVEEALQAAGDFRDLTPFKRLLNVLQDPYVHHQGMEDYERPAPEDYGPHVTYCGT